MMNPFMNCSSLTKNNKFDNFISIYFLSNENNHVSLLRKYFCNDEMNLESKFCSMCDFLLQLIAENK